MSSEAQFRQLISLLLSPHNDERRQAERVWADTKKSNADASFAALVRCGSGSPDVPVRQLSFVLLRQLLDPMSKFVTSVSAKTIEMCKQTLLRQLASESSKQVRKAICYVVGCLCKKVVDASGKWDELLPAIVSVYQQNTPVSREIALFSLAVLADYCSNVVVPHAVQLLGLYQQGLRDNSNLQVRVAALRSTVALLLCMPDDQREQATELIPLMFQTLAVAYSNGDETVVVDSCAILTDLAEGQPKFLRQHLELVVRTMAQLASSDKLDMDTRKSAMAFLVKLAEEGKGMIRSMKLFPQTIIPAAFQFLLHVDHDDTEWIRGEETDYIEDPLLYMGIQSIDRLASSLGGKIFLSVAVPIVQQFVRSQNWLHRHAALIALAEMTEPCRKEIAPSLDAMFTLVEPFTIKDPHPRVRWAALHALAVFTECFSPRLQDEYHERVMSIFQICTDPSTPTAHRRVLRHATLCIVDYIAPPHMEADVLVVYMDALVRNMIGQLKCNDIGLQESVLTCISAMAAVAGEEFGKYYDFFMNNLIDILKNAQGDEKRQLRGNAIECIGMMSGTVDAAKFEQHARAIVSQLVAIQNGLSGNDDPQWFHTEQTLTRIAKVLGEGFKPYLSGVIPHLLRKASQDDSCSFLAQGDAVEDGLQELQMSVRGGGVARLQFNTLALEEKAISCNLLYEYARDLGAHFHDYLDPVFKILVGLVRYQWNDTVRIACAAGIPSCFVCAREFAAARVAGSTEAADSSELQAMWQAALPNMVKAAIDEPRLELSNCMINSVSESIEALTFALPQEHMMVVSRMCLKFIQEMYQRIQEREKVRVDPDFDEREAEVLEEENEAEYDHLGYVTEVMRQLMNRSGDAYFGVFQEILAPIITGMVAVERTIHEQTAALSVLDDLLMHCGPRAVAQYFQPVLKLCLQNASHEDDDLRRAALYGIGVAGKVGGQAFAGVLPQAIQVLVGVIQAPGSRDGDNEEVTDNAIASVVRIVQHHPDKLPLEGVLPQLFAWMPVKGDEIEGRFVHKWFVGLVQTQNEVVLGSNQSNLPRIIQIFADVVNTDAAESDTSKSIVSLVRRFQQGLGDDRFAAILSQLDERQKKNLGEALQSQSR